MIEKKIHYIWLGGKPLPKIAKKCIKSWKKYCPDYEIIRWDENNLNLDSFVYARQAYDTKMYAFASDALRFDILYNEGGIYLDIDVELLGSLDKFLDNKVFSGFESEYNVAPGLIFGAEKNNPFVKEIVDDYKKREFLKDEKQDLTTVCIIVTNLLVHKGMKQNNTEQVIDDIHIYPTEIFCPINPDTFEENITLKTVSIHHYNGSWLNKKGFKGFIKKVLVLILGRKRTIKLITSIHGEKNNEKND